MSMALSLFAVGSDAICPETVRGEPNYTTHNSHMISLIASKNQPPSYDYLQRKGGLCEATSLPALYGDCTDTLGQIYAAYTPLQCEVATKDEVFCATPYNQVVSDLCNPSGCPVGASDFVDLFSLLANCGYLSTVGGAAALDSPEAATACLTQQGACQLDSPNSMFQYATCRSKVKQLMFDGAKFIGLESQMTEPEDCIKNNLLPAARCNEEFGFQVTASYCAVQKSFFEQEVGETTMGTVLLAGSFGGVGALGAIYLRYRRPPAYPNYYSYNDDYVQGFQQNKGQSKFTSYYSASMPSFGNDFGAQGDFGQANAPEQSLYYGEPHQITGPAAPPGAAQSSGRMGRPTDSMMV